MANFCPNCGAKVGEGKRFCGDCGCEVDAPETQAQNTTQTQNPVTINQNPGFFTYTGADIPRTVEIVLSIVGGVFGMLGGVFAIFLAGVGDALGAGTGGIEFLGLSAILASILAIIFGALVRKNPKLYGILLIVCSIWLLISISLYAVPGTILIFIAGLLALVRK